MKYTLDHIARIVGSASQTADNPVEHLLLDSRKIYSPAASLFFALKGQRRDGHQFIPEVYKKGVRSFVISDAVDLPAYPGAGFVIVKDTLDALQQLAIYHRKQFAIPVIGITGSNGKTIVKEWLYQLLHADHTIVRSPKSYNSQIGVPLSVWQMNEQHTLAIFEAGISKSGEMEKLEKIIQPTIGVLTNIGEAHSEGFTSPGQKEKEKRILFRNARQPDALEIIDIQRKTRNTIIRARKAQKPEENISIDISFTDEASVQNAITCWQVMLMLGYDNEIIQSRMQSLMPVNMRLELKKGINQCNIINDSYSADLSSLEIALNFLDQQKGGTQKTVILSDFLQSALKDHELYAFILDSLKKHKVSRFIGIGERITKEFSLPEMKAAGPMVIELYPSADDFLKQFRSTRFKEETILIKGARVFEFERIVQLLEQKVHQTVLEINLNAIAHNLKEYQAILKSSTKVMAMVKAFAYGSGGAEIAGILQYHKVDYLGVAYADEGVELRKAGITLPVMVMNPEESAFESLVEYNLEPDIYSFGLLYSFDRFLQNEGLQQFPVHIEIETGMNRLGFSTEEITKLAEYLRKSSSVKVQTIFSHLAASEDPDQDGFTFMQREKFLSASAELEKTIGYPVIKHIGNSAAIIRHSSLQLGMVRLGIGLYGVDSAETGKLNLQPVATLKSTIAQLKHLKTGESVSYNRKGVVKRDSLIATIRIGYADGFSRRLGNGTGKVWLKGKLVPVIGSVCMDMTMIDVTDIDNVQEGDEVIIFGKELPVQQLSQWAGTIPYEIMTTISQRVKRVYFEE
ncbi:MAG: alanine racemase [Bacteroidota bacterium]